MQSELARREAHIDDFEFCPHYEFGLVEELKVKCACRKPNTGMLDKLCERWPVDLNRSLLVGDRDSDVECAARFGLKGVLFRGGNLCTLLQSQLELVAFS